MITEDVYRGYVSGTKGWVCGVAEKDSDWLGSYTKSHTKEVCTGWAARLATRIRSLMGKVTHLCRVYWIVACHSLFREGTTNAAGKELHKVLVNLRRLTDIVFHNKINLLKKWLRKLAFAYDFVVCGCS